MGPWGGGHTVYKRKEFMHWLILEISLSPLKVNASLSEFCCFCHSMFLISFVALKDEKQEGCSDDRSSTA